MSDLGPCDVCGKPGRWAVVVTGCSEHKIALKAAVENCNSAQQPQLEMPCESDFMAWCGIQHYKLSDAASIYRYIARHTKRMR